MKAGLAIIGLALTTTPGHALPFSVDCVIEAADQPLAISFAIDPNQFAPPVNAQDPPRRKITQVSVEGDTFAAEPFFDPAGPSGFWTETPMRMLFITPEGEATYSDAETVLVGSCEGLQ